MFLNKHISAIEKMYKNKNYINKKLGENMSNLRYQISRLAQIMIASSVIFPDKTRSNIWARTRKYGGLLIAFIRAEINRKMGPTSPY